MISFSEAINVYTDASLTKVQGITSTCAGFCTVYHGKMIDQGHQILYNTTNNFGEAYALYMGVQSLLRHAWMDTFLNLFSDSKITVDGLKYWIDGWMKNMDSKGILYSSSGTQVANQEIFTSIIGMIARTGVHMQLWHILGHKNPNNYSDLMKSRDMFQRENGVRLSEDIIREICTYNDYVDRMTRDVLLAETNLRQYVAPRIAAKRVLNKSVVQTYKNLLSE